MLPFLAHLRLPGKSFLEIQREYGPYMVEGRSGNGGGYQASAVPDILDTDTSVERSPEQVADAE